jgi:23S rRNA (uracil1939-C5)-methyltransferase
LSQSLNCPHVGACGGCAWGTKDFAIQSQEKLTPLRAVFSDARMVPAPMIGVRDRADLVWESTEGGMRLGLFALDRREIVDLETCSMMSSALEAWFREFRLRAPPIRRGSVRLRVSPGGERGVWLDFANEDVKNLFAEREYLRWLSARAFVEIGQRRKALIWRDDQPKLTDPVLKPWFETYDADMKPIPLYGPVGGFSQAGFDVNRLLVEAVSATAKMSGVQDWVELFCGNGNFALALAARSMNVEAVELDELAVRGLELSLRALPPLNLQVRRGDVYLKRGELPSVAGRGLLLDPPRAGLRELLAHMESGWLPRALLYVSCFSDVFVQDAERLKALGFRARHLVGVDQFPFTPHGEWVTLFERT